MRQGNTVATVLLIAVMIAGAGLLVQSQIFPAQTNFVERTINTFSQFVFEDPKDVVKEYALNSYEADGGYWYCGDYSSPPQFEKVVGDFPEFSQALLSGKLETLKQEFPDFDVEISEPNFGFTGVDGDVLVETRVGVNVSNLTVTVRDGERIIGMEYDDQYEYALRFWKNYLTMYDWITTGNGGIYTTIDQVLQSRSCAFVKTQCFCHSDNPDAYTERHEVGPGEKYNPCPCYKHNPVYDEESCESGNPLECQDFVESERQEIMNEFGISNTDLFTIAQRISDTLTAEFESDVTCQAQVSEPFLENRFVSAYVIHPSPCPREQVGGTCGVVPMNVFDTVLCGAQSAPDKCLWCPDEEHVSNEIGQNAFNNDAILNECLGAAADPNCDFVNITDEETGEQEEVYACFDDNGNIIVLGTNETEPFESCTPEGLLGGSAKGASGAFGESPESLYPVACNELPPDANPGPIDEGEKMFSRTNYEATGTVKRLEDISDSPGQSGVWWEGMNGWLDRRGAMDVSITCSDPGTEELDSFETEIDLRIVFRHGCDTSQNRILVWTGEVCGLAADSNIPTCNCDDGNVCTDDISSRDEDGNCVCSHPPIDGTVTDPNNRCQELTCVDGEPDTGNPVFKDAGSSCATGADAFCRVCDGAGSCSQPKSEGQTCGPLSVGVCERATCQEGTCAPTPKEDGGSCIGGGGSCGDCECVNGIPDYTRNPDACGTVERWTSCTTQEEIQQECTGTGPFTCSTPAGSGFDTSVCCPGPGPGSEVCSSGQICCGGDACTTPEACDSQ